MKLIKAMCEERSLAVVLLAGGIFVGLGWPVVADTLKLWALPALFLVIVFSLVPFARLPVTDLIAVDQDLIRVVLWQQAVLPTIAIAAGIVARFPDPIILLMIVTACSGALFSSPAIAEILGLDRQRAMQAMVLSTLLTPISLFLFLSVFRGTQAHLDIYAYALRTVLFLIVPFALLAAYRPFACRLSETTNGHVTRLARWATIVALLIFGTGLMSAVSDKLETNPGRILFMLGLATTLCLMMLGLTTIVLYRYGKRVAYTAAIVSGFRNIGLGYALVGDMVGPDLEVYAGISLIPVFTAPLMLRLAMTRNGSNGPSSEPEPGELSRTATPF